MEEEDYPNSLGFGDFIRDSWHVIYLVWIFYYSDEKHPTILRIRRDRNPTPGIPLGDVLE